MIDRKSLFSTFMNPVVLTLSSAGDFEVLEPGQTIIVSGMSRPSQNIGGNWPRWMKRWHIPERARFWIQAVADKFGYKFGPRRYQIIDVSHGTTIAIR